MKSKNEIKDLGWGTKPKKGLVLRGDLEFQNGAKYSGALKSPKKQIPHGYGIFFFPEHGKTETIDGLGIPTIKYYSGNFKNGKKEGGGKFFFNGHYSYSGQWKNDKFHGKGVFKKWGSDEKFEGYFKNDLRFNGTWTITKNLKYIGKFKNNLPHGKGKLFEENNIYTGNFKEGKKHGYGISISKGKSKEYYKGQWKNNKISGKGIFDFGDGGMYIGSFLDGERHGKGTLIERKGKKINSSFSGNWKNDLRDGIYIFKDKKGKKRKELWKEDNFVKIIN